MTEPRKWCALCKTWVYPDDEVEIECAELDCPIDRERRGADGEITPQEKP